MSRDLEGRGHPEGDILRTMTIGGYKVSETGKTRGPIKAGYFVGWRIR